MITKKAKKSYFVVSDMVKRAKKALGVNSDTEVIRISVQQTVETAVFWDFMDKTAGSVKNEDFKDD